jgi:hypothetical protein
MSANSKRLAELLTFAYYIHALAERKVSNRSGASLRLQSILNSVLDCQVETTISEKAQSILRDLH